MRRRIVAGAALLLAFLGGTQQAIGGPDDWTHYGGNEGGLKYSALDQIDRGNVENLEIAWTFNTGELGEDAAHDYAFETTPILAEGALYLTTGTAIIFALDPATGRMLWRHDPGMNRTWGHSEVANRGVASWVDPSSPPDAPCRHRIFIGTLDSRMIAVDGKTGEPCADFGEGGQVFLNRDVRAVPGEQGNYGITSPPVVIGDTLVTGSAIGDNRGVELELGIVRGLDARTGALRWTWDPIPRNPDNPMHATWQPGEAARTGAANAWAPLSADSERGIVYVPTGSASPDFYGGEREGDNRYANSLVALAAGTGEVLWHQQMVHHDLWDYDIPAQPTLVELRRGGQSIPAVIQGTKMGLIFTFNRITGEPIFGMEERPVPQGGVPGEHLSPTQPFPLAPPPLVRTGPVTVEDAYGWLLFDERDCAEQVEQLRSEGIYTPPSLEGTIELPSYGGGINWGGVAFDPDNQIAVANATDAAAIVALIPREQIQATIASGEFPAAEFAPQRGTPYGMRREIFMSPLGMPCVSPPWGRLTAVDMRDGSIKWQTPLGTIEDIAPAPVPNLKLGVPSMGGPIITAGGLIFIAGAMDDYLRAFDIETGEELWRGRLPAGGQATPMTYRLESTGRQYVVIAAGGHPKLGTTLGDHLVAFALAREE